MALTVEELMDRLSEMPPEAEIRIAHQPSWSFEYGFDTSNPVVLVGGEQQEQYEDGYYEDGEEFVDDAPEEEIVYLVEGSQLGYLPGAAKNAAGW